MKNTLTSLFLLIAALGFGQDFYDLNSVQTIEITFSQTNWDQLLDNAYASTGDYILAESVSINGEVFDSVGVKYKGNSTYQSNQVKNPFHIELDTYKDHQYEAYTDIKLSNVAKDPSFLREVLSYHVLRQYMDAPLSNYANVYVNGTLIGLYSNSEAISKKFVNSRFYSKKNTFIKCNPPAGAGPQSNDFPNLVYLGQDSSNYYDAYELKSDYGWEELINLCDTLANNINDIEAILDVDKALWMLAFNNVLVNLDSYSGGFKQNYYLYRDDYGRFLPVVWDLNESFGQFSMAGGTGNNLNNTAAKQQMDHLLHINDADFPLIQKLLSVPTYKRMYLAHMKTMLLENFDDDSYIATAEALQTLIDADVQADNNKFFTYANFTSNLNSDINGGPGPGGGATPGITNLMDGRNDYLLGLSDFTQTDPTISDIATSTPTPIINETIAFTATVTDADEVTLGYRTELGAPFIKLEMFDDGANNDGAAGDGVYGTNLTITNPFVQYFIYAENSNAGKFSPQRAQYEYYTLTATTTNPTVGDLVINEFMASNDVTVADQDGEFDDWIEFYNNSSTTIDLEGYYLSDDATDLQKWAFLPGAVIEGNSYAIVWADNDEAQTGLHANFKLSASAESIFLSNTAGTIIDEVSYVDQTTDISYGRFPNGVGNFQVMTPTFNGENNGTGTTSISNTRLESFNLKATPNPADDHFFLEIEGDEGKERNISIHNLNGILIYQDVISKNKFIHTHDWAAGMYIIRVDNSFLKIVVN
ncbi:MAG: CotH kinase family protein [Saprospiraceae bacterium]